MEIIRIVLIALIMGFTMLSSGESQLIENFYSSTCPTVESIVYQAVSKKFKQTLITGQATLRLFLHDCFVEGCDASVIIASPNEDAEKDASENLSLPGDGFDTVIKAKQAVEAVCPGLVSCRHLGTCYQRRYSLGPSFSVELGRRDGLVSKASMVEGSLPNANFNLNQLNTMFSKHNLSQIDMIALSGAHTVGFSRCIQFTNRIYMSPKDPSLDPTYAKELRASCPRNADPNIALPLDPQTEHVFDNLYYKNLVSGKGLLRSDQILFTDLASQATVVEFGNNASKFNEAFVTAIKKLGRVGVKTGQEGEIRRDSTKFN